MDFKKINVSILIDVYAYILVMTSSTEVSKFLSPFAHKANFIK